MVGTGVNIPGLKALRQLGKATDELSKVSERLASGQRINRASDDAAGLAIASGLTSKARIYSQSIRNLNDGISALAIADGAAGELSSVLTRLQELSAQAANGSYSSTQRRALDNEAQKLRDEFNRLVASTSFNGTKMLDENTGRIRLEAGVTSSNGALYIDSSNLGVGSKSTRSFTASSSLLDAGTPGYAIEAADIDSDGILDLVRDDNGSGGLLVMRGNGDGTFRSPSKVSNSQSAGLLTLIKLADLNGDGNIDIVAGGDTAAVYLGNGDGSFKSGSTISGLTSVSVLQLADWNRDGKLDLVTGDASANIEVRLSNGDGTFGAASLSQSSDLNDISAMAVGDIDGDGRLDVALSPYTGQVRVFFADSGGDLSGGYQDLPTSSGNFTGDIALADMNGDGRLDILSTKYDGSINYYRNLGSQAFAGETAFGVGGSKLLIVDQDGDGKLDVFGVTATNGLQAFFGNGDGTFLSGVNVDTGASSFSIVSGDLNGDGVLDLASTNGNGNSIGIALSQTTGLSTLGTLSLSTRAGALSAGRMLASAQSALGSARGKIGSEQSRLSSALNSITATRENFQAAAGRIQDADIASETASLARSQILQQTAAQVLAQASLQPQLTLSLLR